MAYSIENILPTKILDLFYSGGVKEATPTVAEKIDSLAERMNSLSAKIDSLKNELLVKRDPQPVNLESQVTLEPQTENKIPAYVRFLAAGSLVAGTVKIIEEVSLTPDKLVLIPAIAEEVIFRGFIQDLLLQRSVKWVAEKISPRHASFVDSTPYKVCCVVLTSAAFTAFLSRKDTSLLIAHFVKGALLGFVKERSGLASSTVLHGMGIFAISALKDL